MNQRTQQTLTVVSLEKELVNRINEEIEEYCNTENKTYYVYDVTDFRLAQGFVKDNWLSEDLEVLDGFVLLIVDCEFVVSDKFFPNMNLLYRYNQ